MYEDIAEEVSKTNKISLENKRQYKLKASFFLTPWDSKLL